jgi:hypothetical protein
MWGHTPTVLTYQTLFFSIPLKEKREEDQTPPHFFPFFSFHFLPKRKKERKKERQKKIEKEKRQKP